MRAVVRATLLLVACLYLGGCDGGIDPETPTESIRMEISLAGDVCGVTSAEAFVSAADVGIGPVKLEVTDTSITGRITAVPAGPARKVEVVAYNASRLPVYSGSTVVDVVAGRVVPARLSLARNPQNCLGSSTGDIDIIGTLESGTPIDAGTPDAGTPRDAGTPIDAGTPDAGTSNDGGTPSDGGIVLQGPEFAFTFQDATLTRNGVLHFFDDTGNRVRRLDLASARFLPPFVGTADITSMAVAPDGTVAYVSYAGGRIDAFNPVDGTSKLFGVAPETVSSMTVTGEYLFTVDSSGAWDTQSLFQRSTGARVSAVEWRDTSRSMVFSPVNKRVYFLDSGVSPTDVHMVELDLATGKVGVDTDSPYHGSYNLPNPLRLLPDESGVIVGSGLIFNAADLSYRSSIGLTFQDIAFYGERMYLIDTVGDTTQLRVLNSTYDIVSAQYFPGAAKRVFTYGDRLVLITEGRTGGLQVRFLTP